MYRRRDGSPAPAEEATDENGRIRDGYSLGVGMFAMDHALADEPPAVLADQDGWRRACASAGIGFNDAPAATIPAGDTWGRALASAGLLRA